VKVHFQRKKRKNTLYGNDDVWCEIERAWKTYSDDKERMENGGK